MSYRQRVIAIAPNHAGRTGSRLAVFRARCVAWEAAGCSPRAAAALADAEIDEVAQIACLGRGFFVRVPNCGPTTLAEIGRLIGGWPEDDETTTIDGIATLVAAGEVTAGEAAVGAERAPQPGGSGAVVEPAAGGATGSMIAGSFDDVEVILSAGRVMIAVRAGHHDAAGFLHRDHAVAGLSVGDAVSLRDQLNDVISAVQAIEDPRQPLLWPHAAFAAPGPAKRRPKPTAHAGEGA